MYTRDLMKAGTVAENPKMLIEGNYNCFKGEIEESILPRDKYIPPEVYKVQRPNQQL